MRTWPAQCDKCDVDFIDNADLKAHVNRYHEVLKQCRFCLFNARLAEVLEHMEHNCEEEEKEVANEEAEDINEEGFSGDGCGYEVNDSYHLKGKSRYS